MYRIGSLLTRRRVIIAAVCLTVLFLIWLVVFHGFIQIKNHKEGQSAYTYQFDSSLNYTSPSGAKPPLLLSSGNYVVQAPMKNGGAFFTESAAPYFLGTKTIDTPDSEASTSVMGRRTAPNLAMSKNGLVSWTSKGEVFSVNSKDPTASIDQQKALSFPNFNRMSSYRHLTQLSKSTIAGINHTSENKQTPTVYSFLDDAFISFPAISANASELSLHAEPDGFSIYDKGSDQVSFYSTTSGEIVIKKVNQGKNIAIFDGWPVYSFDGNNDRLVLATGPEIDSVELTDVDEHLKTRSTVDSVTLRTFDTKADSLLATRNLDEAPIKNITSSPDGKYVAVSTSSSVSFYTTSTLSQMFTLPYTISGQGFWVNGGDFIFNTGTNGVLKASPKNKQARSILPYNLVRPATLAFIDNNDLYMTAFSSVNDYNKQPDAFRVSLAKNTKGVDRKVFRAFPYQGEGFYVDHLNGITTIQLSRYISSRGVLVSESAKQDALEYIKSILGSNKNVNFIYTTTDLRTRSGGDE